MFPDGSLENAKFVGGEARVFKVIADDKDPDPKILLALAVID